jgi:hypothetical protein
VNRVPRPYLLARGVGAILGSVLVAVLVSNAVLRAIGIGLVLLVMNQLGWWLLHREAERELDAP